MIILSIAANPFAVSDCLHHEEGLWKRGEGSSVGNRSANTARPPASWDDKPILRQEQLPRALRDRWEGQTTSWDREVMCHQLLSYLWIEANEQEELILILRFLVALPGWESCTLSKVMWNQWSSWRGLTSTPSNSITRFRSTASHSWWLHGNAVTVHGWSQLAAWLYFLKQ